MFFFFSSLFSSSLPLSCDPAVKPCPVQKPVPQAVGLGATSSQRCLNATKNIKGEYLQQLCTPGKITPNTSFKNNVAWDLQTFDRFLNENPNAKNEFNAIMANYGLVKPNAEDSKLNYGLPDPNHLILTVEQATAISFSFREWIRTILNDVKKYINRSVLILVESSKDIMNKYNQLKYAIDRYKRETSKYFKNSLGKHILDLKAETEESIATFEYILNWQKKVTSSMSANL